MKGIKPLDIAIGAVFMAVLFAGFLVRGDGDQVRIDSYGGTYVYPLDEDRTVSIPGPLGDTVVRIQDSDFSIISSPCPNQTCLYMKMGSSACCLPNRVLVSIERKNGGGVDAISY